MIHPSDTSVQLLLSAAHLLYSGAQSLTFDEFSTALGSSLNAHRASPRGLYYRFYDDPAKFLATHTSQKDAEALIVAMLQAREKKVQKVSPISPISQPQ